MSRISVITVCFNAADKLRKTIESVIGQTYENLEYIIIDGGSSDHTKDVVKDFEDQIDHFISEPDNGIYDAMNKGIQRAGGDLVIFLNAGDFYFTPSVLEYAVSKIKDQPADLFFYKIIWEDPYHKTYTVSDHDFLVYHWDIKHSNFPHPATIYRRKLFEEQGLFDTSFSILADYEWNLRALIKSNVSFRYISLPLVVFTADGISNDQKYAGRIESERKMIFEKYFTPLWLFRAAEKFSGKKKKKGVFEKIAARIYRKKLKRLY